MLLAAGAWALSLKPGAVLSDSPKFKEALRIWHPVVRARSRAPRSIKRFLNRVRYYAMRQGGDVPDPAPSSRLLRLFQRRTAPPEPSARDDRIHGEVLVALGAIQHLNPDLLASEQHWNSLLSGVGVESLPAGTKEAALLLRRILEDHKARFGDWPPSQDVRRRLLEMSAGIRIG
ncbi:MAG TPA: hypothetical protein VJV23_00180 [Candidatus Polarisedimenticolia bacterium]|nr:hypothetical protein [Candidatus Polarisedimenticolia bacterium]